MGQTTSQGSRSPVLSMLVPSSCSRCAWLLLWSARIYPHCCDFQDLDVREIERPLDRDSKETVFIQITFFRCLGAQVSLKSKTTVERVTFIKPLQASLFQTYSKVLPPFCPCPSPLLFGHCDAHSPLLLDPPSIPPLPDLGSEAPWTASEAPWLSAGLGQWGAPAYWEW